MDEAFRRIPHPEREGLAEAIRHEAKERGLLLQVGADRKEPIPIALTPWIFSPELARYLKSLFRGIRRSVNRILAAYFDDPKLQAVLPLRENELQWLKASCPNGIPRPQTLFERFDTNLNSQAEDHLADFQIIEFNAVGVGCIHLMPSASELIETHLIPRLNASLKGLVLKRSDDLRDMLLAELRAHAQALSCGSCRLGLVERRESVPGGCDEFCHLATYFQSKGVPTVVGDPREVEWDGQDGFRLKGEVVDVLYRDFQLEEVVSIKTHGGMVDGIEAAFSANRVVSTVFGEFDHKSLCEILSSPEFLDRLSPQEVRTIAPHIPWTRLLNERKTTDPKGEPIDLVPFVRKERQRLVLKPNRGYGGEGVVVGEWVDDSVWQKALGRALEKPGSWVVQEQVRIARQPIWILQGEGQVQQEELYVTLGITATARGVGFVGRCSSHPVVNVSQGGGLIPVFLAMR